MKAMLLAAGFGKRMRPLTLKCPKPLLVAGGKPLIVHHIERLAAAGVTQLVINTGWLGEQLEAQLGDGSQWQLTIEYSREPQPLETAGGMRHALKLLGSSPFMVVNADIWCDIDFSALAQINMTNGTLAHLVLVNNPVHHPDGDFLLDENGSVNDCGQPRLTFSGVGVYRPELLALDRGEPKLASLLRLAMHQQAVTGEYFRGHWWDIGTPERLQQLDSFLHYRSQEIVP